MGQHPGNASKRARTLQADGTTRLGGETSASPPPPRTVVATWPLRPPPEGAGC